MSERDVVQRFLKYLEPARDRLCIEWAGGQNDRGYGYFWISKKKDVFPEHPRMVRAHRFAYWIFVGPYDLSLTIDHRCHNRLCCNPYHVQPVTLSENSVDANEYRWHQDEYLAELEEQF